MYQLIFNCLHNVFLLFQFIRSETIHLDLPITLSGVVIFELLFYGHWVIVGNSGTPLQKVSAIYCNYYYYGLIHLTDFYTYYFIWCFRAQFIYSTKLRNNTEDAPFGILGARSEPMNDLNLQPIFEIDIGFLFLIDRYSCD